MGNRAVIVQRGESVGIYLHWNGGRDSVEAFLMAAEQLGIRSPKTDYSYFLARFAQMVGNYFGGTTSIGINDIKQLDCDNYDNGLYEIDGFEIVGRRYHDGDEQQNHDTEEILQQVLEVNGGVFNLTT